MSVSRLEGSPSQGILSSGWVVVGACAALLAIQTGMLYSFGIFFKPIANSFGWSREATSGVYSVHLMSYGLFAMVAGWMADRFGPTKVLLFCAFIAGLGFVLTSRVNALWQIYLTYGVVLSIGFSGGFAVTTATTARWFNKHRGLALGVVSAGIGVGTSIVVPASERLIAVFGWSTAYLLLGIAAWIVGLPSALLIRNPREVRHPSSRKGPSRYGARNRREAGGTASEAGTTTKGATRSRALWTLILTYFLLNFSWQMVMVHLVNYTTDFGVSAFVATTFLSTIGISSIFGRFIMGSVSDKIGTSNALFSCAVVLLVAVTWLVFATDVWMFYVFAIIFGFAFGGEVPQMPAQIHLFFGLSAVATLVGVVVFGSTTGGALGSWVGGRLYDLTQGYGVAFGVAAAASLGAVALAFILKKEATMALRHAVSDSASHKLTTL